MCSLYPIRIELLDSFATLNIIIIFVKSVVEASQQKHRQNNTNTKMWLLNLEI